MPNITLRSHIGADGNLHLNIPTALINTELYVQVYYNDDDKQETFSEWWTKQLASVPSIDNRFEPDLGSASQKLNMNEARHLMREFGRGLVTGSAPHNGAQSHDNYLYRQK